MRSAVARTPQGKEQKNGLKGKDPLSEPLNMGQFNGAGVPLSGNALFTFRLLTGGLLTGSAPRPLDKPKMEDKSKKPAEGTDVSQFEDRVMF
jgi:hypothetical protein